MLLTIRDVAERLNVSPGCVYTLVAQREIAHIRIGVGRGTIRVREEDLMRFLADRAREARTVAVPPPQLKLKHLHLRRSGSRGR
jgi:excisionase family DNA binding protein